MNNLNNPFLLVWWIGVAFLNFGLAYYYSNPDPALDRSDIYYLIFWIAVAVISIIGEKK